MVRAPHATQRTTNTHARFVCLEQGSNASRVREATRRITRELIRIQMLARIATSATSRLQGDIRKAVRANEMDRAKHLVARYTRSVAYRDRLHQTLAT